MSAVNFLSRSSMGTFTAAGDQQLPWLPAEEGPDLLDRLIQVESCHIAPLVCNCLLDRWIQQEKEERITAAALPLAMQVNAILILFYVCIEYVYIIKVAYMTRVSLFFGVQLVELHGRHESQGWGGLPPCPKPGFGLRSSNYMSRPKEVTWGRPITGAGSKPMQWPRTYGHQHSQHQVPF